MMLGIIIGIGLTAWTILGGIFAFLLILGNSRNALPLIILCGPAAWLLLLKLTIPSKELREFRKEQNNYQQQSTPKSQNNKVTP